MEWIKHLRNSLVIGVLAVAANKSLSGECLSVFVMSDFNNAMVDETQSSQVVARVKYNPNHKQSITEQSVLKLDFLNETLALDVVSVNSERSSHAYSAISHNGRDILTVAESNGVMMGSLTLNGKRYKFKPANKGDTLIIETDDNQLVEQVQNSVALAENSDASFKSARVTTLGGPDDGSRIDVIVAYTPEFVADQGEANVAAYIAQLEQETNLSFQLSRVNTRVDIVHAYPTAYQDSTNARRDADYFLNRLEEGQELRTLRDQYHADIMVVLTGRRGYDACGYTPMLASDEANALAIVRGDCGTGYYQFAHEIGHIFGADHNVEEASGLGAEHAHGYCGNGWRSIMSYNCSTGGGKRLALWSNPENTLDGEPTGIAGVSNNAKVLNDRALEVSNFRFPVATPDQVTLASPVGIIVTDTTPDYQWQPAERAASYELKVADNNGNVLHKESYAIGELGCPLGVCSVTPTVELPFGLINWWITAENATGKGSESEKGIFAVTPVPIVPEAVTLISPGGIVSDTTPTYSWNAVSISSWYKLVVTDGKGNTRVSNWYTAADANCQSGEGGCFVTPQARLTQNPITWEIQTWNSAGYGEWSESQRFYVFPLK